MWGGGTVDGEGGNGSSGASAGGEERKVTPVAPSCLPLGLHPQPGRCYGMEIFL